MTKSKVINQFHIMSSSCSRSPPMSKGRLQPLPTNVEQQNFRLVHRFPAWS